MHCLLFFRLLSSCINATITRVRAQFLLVFVFSFSIDWSHTLMQCARSRIFVAFDLVSSHCIVCTHESWCLVKDIQVASVSCNSLIRLLKLHRQMDLNCHNNKSVFSVISCDWIPRMQMRSTFEACVFIMKTALTKLYSSLFRLSVWHLTTKRLGWPAGYDCSVFSLPNKHSQNLKRGKEMDSKKKFVMRNCGRT